MVYGVKLNSFNRFPTSYSSATFNVFNPKPISNTPNVRIYAGIFDLSDEKSILYYICYTHMLWTSDKNAVLFFILPDSGDCVRQFMCIYVSFCPLQRIIIPLDLTLNTLCTSIPIDLLDCLVCQTIKSFHAIYFIVCLCELNAFTLMTITHYVNKLINNNSNNGHHRMDSFE